ncbi:NprRB [Bacillus mycoides]|nr:NprRB [Bacillus mycoides]
MKMKKMVFGVLAFIVTLTVAGGIHQYSSKPDIVGQQTKTVQQINL